MAKFHSLRKEKSGKKEGRGPPRGEKKNGEKGRCHSENMREKRQKIKKGGQRELRGKNIYLKHEKATSNIIPKKVKSKLGGKGKVMCIRDGGN